MKRFLKIALVAFLAFELWRIALAGPMFLAFWNDRLLPDILSMADYPPAIAAVVISVAVIAFVVPMTGVVLALRFVHRRLSRFRTRVNPIG